MRTLIGFIAGVVIAALLALWVSVLFAPAAHAQVVERTVKGDWLHRSDLGDRVLGAAVTVDGSRSCVCELTLFAGTCKMPAGWPNTPPQQFIFGVTCGAPAGSRVTRATYLSDQMGQVRSIIMEWQP